MSKCGKGCMPECEYFTTGGCISPFNCPYKIETGYINSATSIPTYMERYNEMSDDDIKHLKAEITDLHKKLKETEHRAAVTERALFNMTKEYMAERKIATTKNGRYSFSERLIVLFAGEAIKQAEKEIAEEKK